MSATKVYEFIDGRPFLVLHMRKGQPFNCIGFDCPECERLDLSPAIGRGSPASGERPQLADRARD